MSFKYENDDTQEQKPCLARIYFFCTVVDQIISQEQKYWENSEHCNIM